MGSPPGAADTPGGLLAPFRAFLPRMERRTPASRGSWRGPSRSGAARGCQSRLPVLSPQAARRPGEAADPRAMVQSRRTWNLGAPPSLRGLWRVGRAPEEPERGMARPAPASPAARPFPHTGPGRLRTGESAFLKCLLISLPSSSRYQG